MTWTWQRSGSARQVMARVDLSDLGLIIERLEAHGRLIRVTSEVDPGDVRPEDAKALLDV
jgi:hypothetical protein